MRTCVLLVALAGLVLLGCNSVDRGPGFSTGPDTTTPLTVTSTTPVDSATGVLVTSAVQATVSADLDPTTVTAQSFVLATAAGDTVVGLISQTARTITLQPATALAALTEYVATLTTAVADTAGNTLAAPFTWSFTTGS